ncbi:MAG: hypothetical protein JNK82_27380 [Myxococcaceae bacterium]|nr:hypothetical protein [Myxococcaceae bacterium]
MHALTRNEAVDNVVHLKTWVDRQVHENRPFNEDALLYAYGDAIGLGQPGVFVDRHGGMCFTIGNAKAGTTVRIGAMSIKRRRVVKAMELPIERGFTFGNTPRDLRVRVSLTASELRRMGVSPGTRLGLQTLDGAERGDITWLHVLTEEQVRPR